MAGDVGEISLRDDCLRSRHFGVLNTLGDTGIPVAAFATNGITKAQLELQLLQWVDVAIANAAIDTMNATPVQLIAAPGSGKIIQFLGAIVVNTFLTTAFELGSGTMDIRYENSSGGLAGQLTNAFVESAATAYATVAPLTCVSLVNKAIVIHASADVTAGAGSMAIRSFYRTVTVAGIAA